MVSPDTARTVVGVIGNVIALGLFLSPVPTFVRIMKKKSVEEFSAVPYLATLMNCMLWVVYGLPMVHPHSMLVITINGSGLAIELTYVLLFVIYSTGKSRMKVLAIFGCEVAFVGIILVLDISLAHTHEKRSLIVGVFCVVFGTGMYLAPLSVMKMVIETKSVEYMPLSISLASFFNAVCWTSYALIQFDLFITIPNSLGVLFAAVQLVLYAMFYKSTQKQLEARKIKETTDTGMSEIIVDGNKAINGYPKQMERS